MWRFAAFCCLSCDTHQAALGSRAGHQDRCTCPRCRHHHFTGVAFAKTSPFAEECPLETLHLHARRLATRAVEVRLEEVARRVRTGQAGWKICAWSRHTKSMNSCRRHARPRQLLRPLPCSPTSEDRGGTLAYMVVGSWPCLARCSWSPVSIGYTFRSSRVHTPWLGRSGVACVIIPGQSASVAL